MKKIILLLTVGIFLSCSSEFKLGNKDISIEYTNEGFELNSPAIPGITLYGYQSEGYLYITKARFFSNWAQGWTEGFYEASGKYKIKEINGGTYLVEEDRLEFWDIISGEIRFKSKYYRNDDGLQKVRNRIARHKEYVNVLKNWNDFNNNYIGGIKKIGNLSGFTLKEHIYPYLFPEIVGFEKLDSKNMLPEEFYYNGYEEIKVEGDNIYWRHDYTISVFPEHIWELRDSGTIYRDFQESPYIFISLYNLEKFLDEIEGIKCH